MNSRSPKSTWNQARPELRHGLAWPFADRLLVLVDAGLVGTICLAPFVFGGRHDLGRLAFVTLVGLTAVAWFARQSCFRQATWTRTAAYSVLLGAMALVVFQLVPLPAEWLAWLSPRTSQLLPMWSAGESAGRLGTWSTLSMTPRETTLALAMLVSYGLWFTVLTQRLQTTADVEWLLNVVAAAAVLMASFGLLQYFLSNGQFFWCYVHPYRTTDKYAMGSFMNRNHFAEFLVLGIGPIVRWLSSVLQRQRNVFAHNRNHVDFTHLIEPGVLLAALAVVLMGIALSMSKGGAIAAATALVVVSACYWRWRLVDGKYLGGMVGTGLVLLGLLSLYGYDEVTARLDDLASGSVEAVDQGEGRRKVWAANLQAIEHGWLMGAAAGSHEKICPVYLDEPTAKSYTHAESGYLQIATENGVGGVALLAAGIGIIATWCLLCLRRLRERAQQLCFGAAAAGLAASLTHSVVDFVWYIPACLSITLALAVCVLRLAQFALPEDNRTSVAWNASRPWWIECTAVATLLAAGTTYAFFRPAMAAIHWDRYLRDAVAAADVFDADLSPLARGLAADQEAMRKPLLESMEAHLADTLRWDPSFADAHLRLAGRYIQRFEVGQQQATNAMSLAEISDPELAARFKSPTEMRAWLERAFGPNVEWLYRARAHALQAATLSPLQGEAYVYLATLGFLAGDSPAAAEAYIAQARRVRPADGDVLYEVGRHLYLRGEYDLAMNQWAKCFGNSGSHQLRIVNLLAGRMPARDFLDAMHPDWRTLREIWACYRRRGQPQDLVELAAYAAKITERDVHAHANVPPENMWLWQAAMYTDLQQRDLALECLLRGYQCNQHVYGIRYHLGYALKDAGKYSEAEPHLRWCLARQPENRGLRSAILEITKARMADRRPVEALTFRQDVARER